ncbi:MAG: hypothetical protein AAF215_22840 [Cyanobacteria bacterium P01_A01_bin.123]
MSPKKKHEVDTIISQDGTAQKKLVQVGRDYVRYLQIQLSSGNWKMILANFLALALVGHGITNSIHSFLLASIKIQVGSQLCSAEINRLSLEIAQAVARESEALSDEEVKTINAIHSAQPLGFNSPPDSIAKDRLILELIELVEHLSELTKLIVDEARISIEEKNHNRNESVEPLNENGEDAQALGVVLTD